jgi:hypothetical protein
VDSLSSSVGFPLLFGNEDPFQLLMYSVSSLVAGGAGILIMVEIGGTNPVQTLLDDSVIALDHSPHQNHNHLNGEANGRVGLIWHLQVQLSSLVQ